MWWRNIKYKISGKALIQEKINFNLDEVSRLLGVSFKKSDINQILTGLILPSKKIRKLKSPYHHGDMIFLRMRALLKKSCVSRN